jgi:hypothetical protein
VRWRERYRVEREREGGIMTGKGKEGWERGEERKRGRKRDREK